MNAPDVRRLLDDLGSVQPPAPDDEFLDRLEFQLRAEAIALAPDTYDAAPWRLPFGIAAAAFSVVVGVAGITVMRDLPHRQVSAQLAAVSGVVVELPEGGGTFVGHSGMVVPPGAIVRVGPTGSATINGIVYSPGQTLKVGGDGRIEASEDEAGDSEFAAGGDEPDVEIGAITVPVPTNQPRAAVASGPESPETTSGGSSVPSTTASTAHDVARSEKPDPAEVIGLADDAPGPASPSTPRSTTETTAGEPSTTSAPKTTTTAPPSTTSGDSTSSTSSTTPSTTVPTTGEPVTPPPAGADTVPPTTVPAPPGGTTTTTIPGDDGPGVDPDGGDGEPVDPDVQPDGGDGDVVPDGGDGDVVPAGGDGDVVPAGGDEGEPFDDGTGDDGASGSDDAGTGGTTDDETAGPSDTTTPTPGSGDTASS